MPFDLDAPILPGLGTSGVRLLDDLDAALGGIEPDGCADDDFGRTTIRIGPVSLGAIDGAITGIHLGPGDRGKVLGAVGSSLAEAEATLGPIATGEEHILSLEHMPGWRILATDPPAGAKITPDSICHDPGARIRLIEVCFAEDGWWTR